MPTGYTAKLYEGEAVSFADFTMDCARAFGALVTMRDDPNGAEIPSEFEPAAWYFESVEKAKEELSELLVRTLPEWRDSENKRASAEVERRAESERKESDLRTRYLAMLVAVAVWEPPTSDHEGLKKFMVEQLESSIRFDCPEEGLGFPERGLRSAEEARTEETTAARERLARSIQARDEEIERCRTRTRWVADLRESLSPATSADADSKKAPNV